MSDRIAGPSLRDMGDDFQLYGLNPFYQENSLDTSHGQVLNVSPIALSNFLIECLITGYDRFALREA